MLRTTPVLQPGDILINDRGFISRELLNYLKLNRGVDTYVPLKKNMETYNQAVLGAKDQNVWETHPNKKRKNQFISSISGMGLYWQLSLIHI